MLTMLILAFTLHPERDQFQNPLPPHQKYYITQYEEPGFSRLTQMKDDYTTNSHDLNFSFIKVGSEIRKYILPTF